MSSNGFPSHVKYFCKFSRSRGGTLGTKGTSSGASVCCLVVEVEATVLLVVVVAAAEAEADVTMTQVTGHLKKDSSHKAAYITIWA